MALINPSYILTKNGDRLAVWSDNPEKGTYSAVSAKDAADFDPTCSYIHTVSYDDVVCKASTRAEAFKDAHKYENHYKFIEYVGPYIQEMFKLQYNPNDLSVAHGDKCYGYRDEWENAGVPFNHGALIYLFTHMSPYSIQVRETENGWVDVCQWVIDFYKSHPELTEYINHANSI